METTASILAKFRAQLIEGGIPEDRADDMVRDAAGRIIQAMGLDV